MQVLKVIRQLEANDFAITNLIFDLRGNESRGAAGQTDLP
jgi:hypothetical protein